MLPLALRSSDGPILFSCVRVTRLRQLNGLHHLTHRAVGKYHRRHAVCIREIKRANGERRHLLNGRGSKDYHVEIAVSAAARRLEIIRLRGLDSAESGASALDIDNDSRKIRARHV